MSGGTDHRLFAALWRPSLATAAERAKLPHEVGEIDRLDEMGVEAALLGSMLIPFRAIAADGDERRTVWGTPQVFSQLVTVHHRQSEVEKRDVGPEIVGHPQCRRSVVSRPCLESRQRQRQVDVGPGDVIFGDLDGVVVIRREIEADVFTAAAQKARGEKRVFDAIKSGMGLCRERERRRPATAGSHPVPERHGDSAPPRPPPRDTDREHTPRVAVINETMASEHWPGVNPIGKRFKEVWLDEWTTVVGVAGDVKYDGLTSPTGPEICRSGP